MEINVPRISVGATVAVQATQGSSLGVSTPTTAMAKSAIVTIGGEIEMSRQSFERAVPGGFDTALSAELASAWAERLEIQVLNGAGSGSADRWQLTAA
jgi:hypothetical protein